MKARLILLFATTLLLASLSMAQVWNAPQEATTTTYDELNPTAVAYEDTVMLFWDADIEDNRQIYYQVFDREGVAVDDTVMLTDDGANYAPNAIIYGNYPDQRVIVTWESYYDQLRDVAVTMWMDYQWQGVFMAFNTDADEYGPDACFGEYNDDEFLVVVGQRQHAVLLKRWDIIEGHPYPVQVEAWETFFDVSNVTCTTVDGGFAMAWQEVSFTDTMCFYREYDFVSGWGDEQEIDLGGVVLFNPSLVEFETENRLLYNHLHDGWTKVGLASLNSSTNLWEVEDSQYFGEMDLNQFDPFATLNGWQSCAVFMTDHNGNSDIYGATANGYEAITSSTYEDLRPCFAMPMWYESTETHFRYLAFWETDRNGDWDIYMSLTDEIVPVKENPQAKGLPDKMDLAVYPNPGNSQFRIDLELPLTGQTRVEIYNTTGQLVDIISDSWMQAGHHAVNWHPVDQPSGIYFVNVVSGETQQIQKLVYMK